MLNASLLAAALLPAACSQQLAKFEPPAGCYIGAYIEKDPVVKGDFAAWERLTGRKHASYFSYLGYGAPFPFRWAQELKARGCAPHIAWEPNGGLDSVKDDRYLRGWAQAAARVGVPIFLRYGAEMNGTWQPYAGDPELFVEKWRLVHHVMAEVAPNVIMVWCPFSRPRATMERYYPGDEYVDWVGVNIYSVHHHDGDPGKPGGEDPREELRFIYDLYAARKPIAICEYAATHYCQACNSDQTGFAMAKAKYLYDSLPAIFPRVKMINWFSCNAATEGIAENDYAVTDCPDMLAAYRALVGRPYFLDDVVGDPVGQAAPRSEPGRVDNRLLPALPGMGDTEPSTGLSEEPGVNRADGPQILIEPETNPLAGPVRVSANIPDELYVGQVEFRINGRPRLITTAPPFEFDWDAAAVEPGEYLIELILCDADGVELTRVSRTLNLAP